MPRHKESERNGIMSRTRRLLLDAATAEFARKGYDGANINQISRTAGFAKGTVYNYFPSKRALMLALIDRFSASHYEFVAVRVRQPEDPARRLRSFFQAGFDWIVDNLSQGRVMLTMLNGPDAEFKQRMWQGYQLMHKLLIDDVLVPGIEQGVFRQVDPPATAGLLMTLYLGIGSTVDDQGRSRLAPDWTADMIMAGLLSPAQSE